MSGNFKKSESVKHYTPEKATKRVVLLAIAWIITLCAVIYFQIKS